MKRDPCQVLEGVVAFHDEQTSFSDRASRVGVFDGPNLGINGVAISYNRRHRTLSPAFCTLAVVAEQPDQGVLLSQPSSLRHAPHCLRQDASGHGLGLTALILYPQRDTPCIYCTIENEADETQSFRIVVSGQLSGSQELLRSVELIPGRNACRIEMVEPIEDNRAPRSLFDVYGIIRPSFQIEKLVAGSESLDSELAVARVGCDRFKHSDEIHFCLVGELFDLAPKTWRCVQILTALAIESHDVTEESLASAEKASLEASRLEKEARARWNVQLSAVPHPPADAEALYYHSWYCLLRNLCQVNRGLWRDRFACLPGKGHYDAAWLWDSAFHALGLAMLDPQLARDSVLILTENQDSQGKLPSFCAEEWNRPGEAAQPPVVAWCAWQVYQADPRRQFLEAIYEPLVRWNRWWFSNRDDDADGLAEYYDAIESGWDNSPRWDDRSLKLEATDLNSFLVVQMKALARMARELGSKRDAREWERKSAELAEKIVAVMYCPQDGIFYDVVYDTHGFHKVLTPACFLPLWAGVPIERSKADRMIEDYLLNPEHFNGPVPLPVVAASERTYAPSDYWRGPVWIHLAYFCLQTLRRYGYEQQAEEMATKLLDAAARNRFIYEYYDSQTGEGLGCAEFGWSAVFLSRMILGVY